MPTWMDAFFAGSSICTTLFCLSYSISTYIDWQAKHIKPVHKVMTLSNFLGILATILVWVPFYARFVLEGEAWWRVFQEEHPFIQGLVFFSASNAMLINHLITFIITLGLRRIVSWWNCVLLTFLCMIVVVLCPFLLIADVDFIYAFVNEVVFNGRM